MSQTIYFFLKEKCVPFLMQCSIQRTKCDLYIKDATVPVQKGQRFTRSEVLLKGEMSSAGHLIILGFSGHHHKKIMCNFKKLSNPAEIFHEVQLQSLQCRTQEEHKIWENKEVISEAAQATGIRVALYNCKKPLCMWKREDLVDRSHWNWEWTLEIRTSE